MPAGRDLIRESAEVADDAQVPAIRRCFTHGRVRYNGWALLDNLARIGCSFARGTCSRGSPADHQHRWVAYHGDRLVAIGSSKRQLFQECRNQDLPPGEFVVRLIEPEILEEIDWNESRDI